MQSELLAAARIARSIIDRYDPDRNLEPGTVTHSEFNLASAILQISNHFIQQPNQPDRLPLPRRDTFIVLIRHRETFPDWNDAPVIATFQIYSPPPFGVKEATAQAYAISCALSEFYPYELRWNFIDSKQGHYCMNGKSTG